MPTLTAVNDAMTTAPRAGAAEQYLTFAAGGREFALGMSHVRAICLVTPESYDERGGSLVILGRRIPLVQLHGRGDGVRAEGAHGILLADDPEDARPTMAVLADRILNLVDLPARDVRGVTACGQDAAWGALYAQGVWQAGRCSYTVLGIAQSLAQAA